MVDTGSIVKFFCFCWSFIVRVLVIIVLSLLGIFNKKIFIVFGPHWSNRFRFRSCCFSSFHICVYFYLTEFLPRIFTAKTLGTKIIRKTTLKTILLLVFKIIESLNCVLKCRLDTFNIKNQILAVVVLVLILSYSNISLKQMVNIAAL